MNRRHDDFNEILVEKKVYKPSTAVWPHISCDKTALKSKLSFASSCNKNLLNQKQFWRRAHHFINKKCSCFSTNKSSLTTCKKIFKHSQHSSCTTEAKSEQERGSGHQTAFVYFMHGRTRQVERTFVHGMPNNFPNNFYLSFISHEAFFV